MQMVCHIGHPSEMAVLGLVSCLYDYVTMYDYMCVV